MYIKRWAYFLCSDYNQNLVPWTIVIAFIFHSEVRVMMLLEEENRILFLPEVFRVWTFLPSDFVDERCIITDVFYLSECRVSTRFCCTVNRNSRVHSKTKTFTTHIHYTQAQVPFWLLIIINAWVLYIKLQKNVQDLMISPHSLIWNYPLLLLLLHKSNSCSCRIKIMNNFWMLVAYWLLDYQRQTNGKISNQPCNGAACDLICNGVQENIWGAFPLRCHKSKFSWKKTWCFCRRKSPNQPHNEIHISSGETHIQCTMGEYI